MKNHPFRLFYLIAIAAIAALAIVSGLQFQAEASDVLLLCSNTGQQCRSDLDCTRVNVTCFCANVNPTTKVGVCRGDLEITNPK
ncbi:MAG: hypothetical protein QOF89_1645 [Acidobacteriota bacterium]|jgi:hypothetical protein|nr:hypothetical protein [Acidobacteriota bacterium]